MLNITNFFKENPISTFFIVFIVLMVTFGGLGFFDTTNNTSSSDHKKVLKNSSIIEKIANEERKKLPINLGNMVYKNIYSVFDTLFYVYEVNPSYVDNIISNADKYETDLIQTVCSNKDMQPVLNADIKLVYQYQETNGNILKSIQINKESCLE
ncbi:MULTISPECIES: hypothetical protein [Acinetobacter]|nr:hypothetical protein [Acinetobacter baumannii]TPT51591.1 hypothetical protein FJU64_19750 [Acinetobacter baumannii]